MLTHRLVMSGMKNKAKPSAMVPIVDRSSNDAKPKKMSIRMIDSGRTLELELEYPNGAIEHWPMVPKPKNTEVGLEAELCCGDGQGFDQLHEFYLNMQAMFKKVLCNARDTKNNKQNHRKGGKKACVRKAPNQNIDEDNNNVAEAPPPKQCPATKSNDKPAGKKDKGKKQSQMPEEPDQPSGQDNIGLVLTKDEEKENGEEKEDEEDKQGKDEEMPKAHSQKKLARHIESAESVDSPIPSTLQASLSIPNVSGGTVNQEESTQDTLVLGSPLANPKKRKTPEVPETAATHAAKKSCTTDNSTLTSAASDSSLSPPPLPALSHPVNQNAATASKGAQKKCDTLDTVEQPPPAKKQKTATKGPPKEKAAGANPKAVANRSDSWSASYHEEVASLPPPPAPKKAKKAPAPPAPESSDTSMPSDPSTSASKPCHHPTMHPPPDSSPAPTTTCSAKAELLESVEVGGSDSSKQVPKRVGRFDTNWKRRIKCGKAKKAGK
ncbi:hypothetical protein FRC10_008501 [Ceratobasidium sp. 414]|nr:hypothetical protein FRC10_008501 [Ceratobasidium sp. 414]